MGEIPSPIPPPKEGMPPPIPLPIAEPPAIADIPPKSMDKLGKPEEEEEEEEEEGDGDGGPDAVGVPDDIPWLTKAATLLRISLQTERC